MSVGWLVIMIRLYLGGILVAAGLLKILSRGTFAQALTSYQMLPRRCVQAFARLLPATEVVVGVCLVFGKLVPWAEIAAAGLFSIFTGAVVFRFLAGGPAGSCGCGLLSFKRIGQAGPRTVVRNLLFVALAVAAAGWQMVQARALIAGGTLFIIWLFAALAAQQHPGATALPGSKHVGDRIDGARRAGRS